MGIVGVLRNEGLLTFLYKAQRKIKRVCIWRANRLFNTKIVKSYYGVLLTANWDDATFRFCMHGSYGKFLSNYLRGIDYPFIFIDIGANQGLYSLIAAQNMFCEKVVSLEPVSKTFDLLASNIRVNGLADIIVALNCGLSSENARVKIRLKAGHSGAASLHNTFGAAEGAEEIQISTAAILEPYLASGLPLVVKIDTEGHEDVVIGELARSDFANRVASVFYEVDVAWSDPENLKAGLRGMGLNHFDQIGGGTHYDVLASREAGQTA
ncbi:FkbM family methyltransferase [Ancylobacter aquaticus]|uniref:FkbM family methyltransferase n=1 Tax=Ancylobacter aquaticus TaxID=100 RepID=A0A4R1HPT7_ANCAQ|nr:FkbM family methyltransferase [Ancylobacter aquaticus]TCK23231.1 FkbM family methyltransferase [Ancylobacter aquaticus]